METSKEQILKALEEVIFFPEGDNIVNLGMVQDLKLEGKEVSFNVVFPKINDPSVDIVIKSCEKTIHEKISNELNVHAKAVSQKDAGGGPLSGIKNIIAVASGKGGVGKSTVAVNLAIALSKTGAKVGLLDADIYGPSIPTMLDLEDARPDAIEKDGKTKVLPVEKYGIKVLSIGFFVKPEQALIWRGPMASKALEQLFNDAEWGELDYMVLDLPPGTGDIHLTMAQDYPISGAVIVSTPQKVAMADVRKAVTMFQQEKIYIPVLGLIENMSYFSPAELPDNRYYIFGKSYSEQFAKKLNIPFLGQIPMVESIATSGDQGKPVALKDDSTDAEAFKELANNIIKGLKLLKS